MMDDLQQAYAAYQNALINLRNPKVRGRGSPSPPLILETHSSLPPRRNRSYGTA